MVFSDSSSAREGALPFLEAHLQSQNRQFYVRLSVGVFIAILLVSSAFYWAHRQYTLKIQQYAAFEKEKSGDFKTLAHIEKQTQLAHFLEPKHQFQQHLLEVLHRLPHIVFPGLYLETVLSEADQIYFLGKTTEANKLSLFIERLTRDFAHFSIQLQEVHRPALSTSEDLSFEVVVKHKQIF